ncbi:hypothetical protein MHOL44478_12985 [Mycobacterium holsaticum DSM 44478]|nr:hypothetical protein [Mycolicibacterium holsaticum DSM 44478 = JCM 12374]
MQATLDYLYQWGGKIGAHLSQRYMLRRPQPTHVLRIVALIGDGRLTGCSEIDQSGATKDV